MKFPVISRLSLAWLGALGAVALTAGGFYRASVSETGFGRIALPVDQIEMLARAAPPPREERLQPPPLAVEDGSQDAAEEAGSVEFALADGAETQDRLTLIYPDEDEFFTVEEEEDNTGGDVIIRIPGQSDPAAPARAASLRQARPIPDPDPAMLQTTSLGRIPRVAPDGRKAVQYYAKPFEGARNTPRLAVIVGGLGLNAAITERAIDDLPPEVSLSFAPYAKNLEFWTQKARRAGHEVLIELPMEGYGANPKALGAAALLSDRTPQENLQRLDWLMSRFGGYVAATNYMGAKFTADEAAVSPVLQKLNDAGVGYVDDTGAAARAGAQLGLPMASVSRMIPAAADANAVAEVQRELAALEQTALRDGFAIGKTYAYAATIDEIAAWARTLENKEIAHAPVSALLRSRAAIR
ncbi:divergent polysaccharide deacetylase family protein [Hyphococcus sp.]|uniref:divergent polysaccharide deacetylase family protein n=1 Tax=Hyphococcus sp. TaxID=2038636 RepID=UPI003CCB7784